MFLKRKYHLGFLLATLSSCFVLASCDLIGSRSQSNTDEVESITIAQFGDFFLYAPLYVAIDAGFFEQNGLDVSLTNTGGDDKTWAAVLSGNAVFGVADPAFVPIADARGQSGRVIANIVNGVPFWGVAKDPEVSVDEPQDLEKYSVATLPSPSTSYTLQKDMFEDAGLQPNIREGGFGTLFALLEAGQVDIALELEPNVSQAVSDGSRIVYSMADIYGDFAITGLTATPETIQERPELARKVTCGLQQAIDYIKTEPEKSLENLLARFPEIDRNVAEAALKRVVEEDIIPDELITDAAAWDKAVDLRIEVGDLESAKDIGEYIDNTFAEQALNECRYQPS